MLAEEAYQLSQEWSLINEVQLAINDNVAPMTVLYRRYHDQLSKVDWPEAKDLLFELAAGRGNNDDIDWTNDNGEWKETDSYTGEPQTDPIDKTQWHKDYEEVQELTDIMDLDEDRLKSYVNLSQNGIKPTIIPKRDDTLTSRIAEEYQGDDISLALKANGSYNEIADEEPKGFDDRGIHAMWAQTQDPKLDYSVVADVKRDSSFYLKQLKNAMRALELYLRYTDMETQYKAMVYLMVQEIIIDPSKIMVEEGNLETFLEEFEDDILEQMDADGIARSVEDPDQILKAADRFREEIIETFDDKGPIHKTKTYARAVFAGVDADQGNLNGFAKEVAMRATSPRGYQAYKRLLEAGKSEKQALAAYYQAGKIVRKHRVVHNGRYLNVEVAVESDASGEIKYLPLPFLVENWKNGGVWFDKETKEALQKLFIKRRVRYQPALEMVGLA